LLGDRQWARVAGLSVVGAVATAAWFHGYAIQGSHPPPSIWHFLEFVLTFLGLPFARISESVGVGILGGLVFLFLSVTALAAWTRGRVASDPMSLALLMVIAYVGGTALLLAYGRAFIDSNAARISRYATPALVAWSALLLLHAANLKVHPKARRIFPAVAVGLGLVCLPVQLEAVGPYGPRNVQQCAHAALAIMRNIYDPKALSNIYPVETVAQYLRIREGAARMAALGLSIFADPVWERMAAAVGTSTTAGFHACEFHIDLVEPVEDNPQMARVRGWVIDRTVWHQPTVVMFAHEHRVVGLAMSGFTRPDVAWLRSWKGLYGGFDGYIPASAVPDFSVVCPDVPLRP